MMTHTDLLAWVCAANGWEAYEIWQRCNPKKLPHEYTNDKQIKAFWDTAIGRAILWLNEPRNQISRIPHYWRVLKWRIGKYVRI